MIAERAIHSYSNGKLNELELDGYCDFGFPTGHATWEFGKLAATLPRVSSSKLDLRSSKLDEVIRTFAKVFDGSEIDTSRLLRACRAHLELMKSGGAAMCLVAKDLESNLHKAEALFKKSPKECKTLASLLELERKGDIHNGNVLSDPSAAMGLLWIRRSLAFQSHLFESLMSPDGQHPKDAAYQAYNKHLSPYHGWMLRTVFPASLSQMPQRAVFLSKFGEVDIEDLDHEQESKIVRKLGAFIGTLEHLINEWKDCFEKFGLEDTRRV
mmetsp:Transcript_21390/g.46444  ORF Transcript_21390/g.46444 Transcript_21390/m.46444 type:complete len:269 (-) Transcript_21390:163-969(-)|eukprot:CAMPEP_0172298634 /NCGR_PEP_ID=MMETSP1058-20130122/1199_1 /TAXON_ID=83371 /ORGANISM="Detonula confervacea, Strain CCMP 353" /LENGTH=268 /DNA_ID=CAMNT_0013007915 /DNA_START=245 /DNA_END=1051 /DNA_ORIENTATION=-